MPVFQYKATIPDREDYSETGTVVARDEQEATEKLKRLNLRATRLKRLTGFMSFLKRFTADIK